MAKDYKSLEFGDVTVHVFISPLDEKTVIEVEGPKDKSKLLADGSPDIRLWLNEALIYREGEVGEDLEHPVINTIPDMDI